MKKALILSAFCTAVAAAIVTSALWPQEYARMTSPDDYHVAVAEYRAYAGWLPVLPGASGDKSGWVTVFTREGKKIGNAKLDMVSQLRDLRWTSKSVWIPGRGEMKL